MSDFVLDHTSTALSPIFIPALVLSDTIESYRQHASTDSTQRIAMVEAQTGHMTFADYFLTDTLQRQTWTDLNIEVSKASHFVYDIEYATSCLSIYCDTTLSLIENLESDSRFSSSAHRVRHSSIKLKENLSITKLGIRTLHHNLNYLKARCEIQQRTLFNLITREDASVNIRIAEDSRLLARASKRDSVAMKTMSVVTMAFLPGTFVAALCSSFPTLLYFILLSC